jgi:hypothetical protein
VLRVCSNANTRTVRYVSIRPTDILPFVQEIASRNFYAPSRYRRDLLQRMQRNIDGPPHRYRGKKLCLGLQGDGGTLSLLLLALATMTGCGYERAGAGSMTPTFSISPAPIYINGLPIEIHTVDTNCAGCNAVDSKGNLVDQFTATFSNGIKSPVSWSLTGGDAVSGPGTISSAGRYTPPGYLTEDRIRVVLTATADSDPSVKASTVIGVTPGFLEPLSPENVAIGSNGSTNITGYISEVGGRTGIDFEISASPDGTGTGLGTLGRTTCKRDRQVFTSCTVTYFPPASIAATGVTYVVAKAGASSARVATRILLNDEGLFSNPTSHQMQMPPPLQMGSSGGNNNDYDLSRNRVVDCCSGTLGSLLKGSDNKRYLLSNNHVLARSDQASVGDSITQPGLIDNNCMPNGEGQGITSIGSLTGWLALKSSTSNADAAIALVTSGSVDLSGDILEMGARQFDGTLGSAPPGTSSTGGKGESPVLQLKVAKSGRTTGQTCANITAINLDVSVDYYLDCAETKPYLSKIFTDQIAISGNGFSDAGDSGALVLDSSNAEPVGLLFAGGIDTSGVSHAVANPAPDVLNELNTQLGDGVAYSFVGGPDHVVSCLNYGDSTVERAQAISLSDAEIDRAQQAIAQARSLVDPASGILGEAMGKSNDDPGEAAIIVYTEEGVTVSVPASVGGVRTMVIPSNIRAVAAGAAPLTNATSALSGPGPSVLSSAIAIHQQVAASLMKANPAFFGIGVGVSLDNPAEAALVIYVDRKKLPGALPQSLARLRTRYIVLDRLHVTRSYAVPMRTAGHCQAHQATDRHPLWSSLDSKNP